LANSWGAKLQKVLLYGGWGAQATVGFFYLQLSILVGTTSTATKVSPGEFELVQQSKKFVPGSLVGVNNTDS
jgi:hypothetical protein